MVRPGHLQTQQAGASLQDPPLHRRPGIQLGWPGRVLLPDPQQDLVRVSPAARKRQLRKRLSFFVEPRCYLELISYLCSVI